MKLKEIYSQLILESIDIDEIIDANIQPDQDYNKIKSNLVDFYNMIQNLPDIITLYRVLNIGSKAGLNPDLGSHFTLEKKFNDDFLYSIGLKGVNKENLKIISIKTNKSNIKIGRTLAQHVMYPQENEIYLNKHYTYTNLKVLPYKF